MAQLKTQPNTSTVAQRRKLVLAAKRIGLALDDIYAMVDGRKLHNLSSAETSALITRLSGDGLHHPPGKAPRPYHGRRERGVTRIITLAQIEQITRLALLYFGGNAAAVAAWMLKDWKCPPLPSPSGRGVGGEGEGEGEGDYVICPEDLHRTIRHLATAQRAGECIAALKQMVARKRPLTHSVKGADHLSASSAQSAD
jgi:hypothetical protein